MWMALQSAAQASEARRAVNRATARRVLAFARPHRRGIVSFLVLATIAAVLGVATPVLAGEAVNAIVDGQRTATVVALAVAIAIVVLVEALVGLAERLWSARLGEGLILDLRRQ